MIAKRNRTILEIEEEARELQPVWMKSDNPRPLARRSREIRGANRGVQSGILACRRRVGGRVRQCDDSPALKPRDVGDAHLLLSQQCCAWEDRFPCAFPWLRLSVAGGGRRGGGQGLVRGYHSGCVRVCSKGYGWDRYADTIARAIFGSEVVPPLIAENLAS